MRFLLICLLVLFVQISWGQKEITIDDLWTNYAFFDNRVPGFNFQIDGRHYVRQENNKLNAYDIKSGERTTTLFDASKFKGERGFDGQISGYSFSDNESHILIKSETESIYRHSTKAHFFIYNTASQAFSKLHNGDKQMYATVAPGGKRVAFVVNNDLYVKELGSGELTRITTDGKINEIINGATDWVYEEEFSMSRGFQWSPDGQRIAFLRFDERDVQEYTMMNYTDNLYPDYVTFKYPKVGERNAKVSVKIYDVDRDKTVDVDLPNEELYIPRIKWTNSSDYLVVTTLNRHQNHLRLFKVKAKKGKSSILLEEKNKYYIDIHDDLKFLEDGDHFVWTSEKNGYNHVYLYDMKGREKRNLTPGDFDVTAFYGVDEKNGVAFYQVADESPTQRNIYRISLDGKSKEKLSQTPGWNSGQFSSTHDYFVANHSTMNTPPTYRVFDRDGKLIRDLELNEDSRAKQIAYGANKVEFFNFKTNDDVELNGYMVKPDNFDENKEYPVFMYLYGGPNSQQVVDRWIGQNYWWFQMLADKGYVVACVDNRGTGARGEEFRKMTYQQLGKYETIDQIEAAKHLGSLPYIDAGRIGIFGWSYGGYMSTLCLLKGNDVFKMAIAVAPVTNWKWYDTIYTERFMRTDKENPGGYKDNSPIYFADRLKGKYLLVHGGADDNVHVQNSLEMAGALINANKQFDFYYYPNNNHGIYAGNARRHLYTKMTNFIEENL